jgi:hypothetical protein
VFSSSSPLEIEEDDGSPRTAAVDLKELIGNAESAALRSVLPESRSSHEGTDGIVNGGSDLDGGGGACDSLSEPLVTESSSVSVRPSEGGSSKGGGYGGGPVSPMMYGAGTEASHSSMYPRESTGSITVGKTMRSTILQRNVVEKRI